MPSETPERLSYKPFHKIPLAFETWIPDTQPPRSCFPISCYLNKNTQGASKSSPTTRTGICMLPSPGWCRWPNSRLSVVMKASSGPRVQSSGSRHPENCVSANIRAGQEKNRRDQRFLRVPRGILTVLLMGTPSGVSGGGPCLSGAVFRAVEILSAGTASKAEPVSLCVQPFVDALTIRTMKAAPEFQIRLPK